MLAVLAGAALSAGNAAAAGETPPADGTAAANAPAAPADSPESLAVDAARTSGSPVAVPALTDENTEVSAQPDGTLVATIHANPVRTRKGGKWAAIDTQLQSAPDGGVAPKAVLPGLEFSGGGSQPLVRMSSAGKDLALSWPDPLPKPVVSGNTAEYRDILPDVDLRMTATPDGFTQLVVIKTAQAAKNPALDTLRFGMSSSDLDVRENADGSLSAVDAGGGTVFTAPLPVMFDSSAAAQDGPGAGAPLKTAAGTAKASPGNASAAKASPAEAAPADAADAHAAPVGVQIAADQTSMTLTPDQDLLTAPGTVYPVMIDPGITTPHPGGWTGISRTYPSQPYWKFTYNSTYVPDFGTGYCVSPSCATDDVKRVLYAIPVHGQLFNGKHILSAEFDVAETHAFSCRATDVQLYATGKISSSTTWNNSSSTTGSSPFWADYLQTINAAKGWSSTCPAGNLEFGGTKTNTLRDKVQQAATGNWTNVTLGLKAADESDPYGWKRFGDKASLQVRYNTPPKQPLMKDLSMSPGSACQTASVLINKWPQVTAKVYDPDNDRLGVQFAAAWDSGDGFRRRWWSTGAEGTVPASNTFKASGSQFSMTLPSAVPGNTGKPLGWEVRAWDGAQWGPWSSTGDAPTDCYFRIDTSAPAGPAVTSPNFPGSSTLTDTLPWTDGVGRYGTFTFDTTATDAVSYQYGVDAAPSSAHQIATTAGAAASVHLLQAKEGPHYVSARALDASGNASSVTTYYYNVRAGQVEQGSWGMDDAAGAGSLSGGGGTYTATLSGAAAGGSPGHSGTALSLPGTTSDFASTPGAVLDTSGSFTVSAWVNLADTGTSRSAVSQDGSYVGGFSLGFYDGKWTFKTASKDAAGYLWQTAASTRPVVTGTWTHLTGVYNQAAHTETLYVDGVPTTAVAVPAAPNATGALQFGRMRWQGGYSDPWQGAIDDVQLWSRALTASEAAGLAAGTPVTTGLPAKAVWSLDETGTTMTSAPDTDSATAYGDVTTGVPGISGTATRFGLTGYARTARPQVDATRSFSVSAWVKLPVPAVGETRARMVVSQNGVHNNEFSLYYSTYYKTWIFGRYQEDSSTDTLVRAMQPACKTGLPDSNGVTCLGPTTGEWTHLVGVSDATAHRIQLFVNGYLVSTTAYTQTTPWPAPGGLQIGAVNREGANDEFFGGDIDDLRVFDRVVTSTEVQTMMQQRPQVAGRWKFNDATAATPPVSPDDLGTHPAALYGPAVISPDAALGTGALSLDGRTAYAATTGAPLHTGESFTLAGWVQFPAAPTADGTLLSIGDGTDSSVSLRWHYLRTDHDPDFPDDSALDTVVGEWQAETVTGGTPRVHTVVHQTAVGQAGYWTHLAVTYDAFSNQLVLYVNGQVEDQVCDDDDTSGTCTDDVSYTGADQPFEATSGLQFGRAPVNGAWGKLLSGQIDDVWAYQGVLSPAQIISLAYPSELDTPPGA